MEELKTPGAGKGKKGTIISSERTGETIQVAGGKIVQEETQPIDTKSPDAELLKHEAPTQDPKNAESWTDDEMVDYYEQNLSGRAISSLDEDELKVVTRHGQIASSRRGDAEQAGADAEREQIRRLVSVQVDRYAMASYLKEAHAGTVKNVRNSKESTPEFQITMRYGGREISLDAATVATSFGNRNNPKVAEFERSVNGLLQLLIDAAAQQRSRIERHKGKDFSDKTMDLRWRDRVEVMRAEDSE